MRRTPIVLLSILVIASSACDPVAEPLPGAPQFAALGGTWAPAVRVSGNLVNTAVLEGCPSESPDGQMLFFATNRDPDTGTGDIDIYVAHRTGRGEWAEPERLPDPVNSAGNDFCPTSLPGGVLLFVSDRNDGLNCGPGKTDIYETRLHPSDGWLEPRHLGCDVNSSENEFAPSYVSAGGGSLFFSSDRTDGVHRIYVSLRAAGQTWQTPTPVAELNSEGYNTFRPNVSTDGREIVFDSNRPTSLGLDIWYSSRANVHATWSAPVRLPDDIINTAANEARAAFSRDGKRLYFGSTFGGSTFDLFVSERR